MKKTTKAKKALLKPKKRSSVKSRSKTVFKKPNSRTNLPIHKRFILHPMTIMVVLIVGVLMIGITFRTMAQTISATVEAPSLTTGAAILSPTDGATLSAQTITVTGNCPDNSYVKLSVNNTFSGVAWCASDNTWLIQTSLSVGQNTLLAQDYNVTDVPGPVTSAVNVSYTEPIASVLPPAPQPQVTRNDSQTAISIGSAVANTGDTGLPVVLSSDFHYQAFDSSSDFSWTFDLSGGTPPYILTVDWGDGTNSTIDVPTDPVIVLHHKYANPGYYPLLIKTSDAKGSLKTLQLAALIKPVGASGLVNFNTINTLHDTKLSHQSSFSSFMGRVKSWLWLAWPTYLIVLLMVISYWLGEKTEYQLLFKRRHQHSPKR
ncbi:MAG TPA: hypothetical protein VIH90_01505 [Candidatus Saccharimonadales bacterium]